MGLFDWLFGRKEEPQARPEAPTPGDPGYGEQQPPDADERALQRYRYMLKTAPPETIEQAHEEAFAKLTPAQRAQALRELAAATPEEERAALAGGRDDPKSLARLATRAEMRQPGTMERTFGGVGGGFGLGGTIFASLAAGFVGSMIAQQFLYSAGDFGEGDADDQSVDEETYDDSAAHDYGDSGGDFGGGDFGGGDF